MNQKILIFCMNSERQKAIRKIANSQKIQIVDVKDSLYDQQIGFVAGITGFQRMPAGKIRNDGARVQKITEEMVVFCGLNSGQIDSFLEAWKQSGQKKIERKAAVTPVNIFWTPCKLYAELDREHSMFQQIC